MAKVVVSSALSLSAVALGIALLDKVISARFGTAAGEIATLIGNEAQSAASAVLKPNSADTKGLPVEIESDGKDNTTAEAGAALGAQLAENEAAGLIHGA